MTIVKKYIYQQHFEHLALFSALFRNLVAF